MRPIDNALMELKSYDASIQSSIISSGTRIEELENRINALEKLIESITDIDWNTLRFMDRNETS
jgi:archaellum component FlaC